MKTQYLPAGCNDEFLFQCRLSLANVSSYYINVKCFLRRGLLRPRHIKHRIIMGDLSTWITLSVAVAL